MVTPTIEIRSYLGRLGNPPEPPHTFIVITNPDGTEMILGFHPKSGTGDLNAIDGIIMDDTSELWDTTTGPMEITNYQALMDFVHQSEINPPTYSLFFGSECTNWAIKAALIAGIPMPLNQDKFPDDSILASILRTIIWNPYSTSCAYGLHAIFGQLPDLLPGFSPAGANMAKTGTAHVDPLVFDLDGDGIETTGITSGAAITFDLNGDGVKTGTGWVSPDDGFLVLDRNGNGTIDSGLEMFGSNTIKSNGQTATDGIDALRDFDSNNDGVIDASDPIFSQLRIWRDLNQDGISEEGELITLSEAGITSISLKGTTTNTNLGNGNIGSATTTFTRSNGTTGTAANLNLVADSFYSSMLLAA